MPRIKCGSVPTVPVLDGVVLAANLTTNFQFCNVTLECSARNTIRFKLNPKPKEFRLRLVEISKTEEPHWSI